MGTFRTLLVSLSAACDHEFSVKNGGFSLHVRRLAPILTLGLFLNGCGILPAGNNALTEGKPSGTVVANGSFTTLVADKTTTGAVSVYLGSSGTYIIRLEGLSAPSGTLQVVGDTSTQADAYTSALRSSSGDQNYFTNLGPPLTWTSVYIRNPALTTNRDYARATLQAVP